MRGGTDSRGYTIIEVMIFLAVSGFMFIIAAAFISGKQAKTEFQQGMNTMNSQLQQVISDVSNGVAPVDASGTPVCANSSGDCVLYGAIVQFGTSSYTVTPVTGTVGTAISSSAITSYGSANLGTSSASTSQYPWAMTVTQVLGTGVSSPGDGLGFFGSLPVLASNGTDPANGSQTVVAATLTAAELGNIGASVNNPIDQSLAAHPNPTVQVCFQSNAGQYGYLTIGEAANGTVGGQRLSTSATITGSSPGGPCA